MENKYVFGAYANLAVLNLVNSLNGIAKKQSRKLSECNDSSKVPQLLNELFDPSYPLHHIEKLVEDRFPWIKPILNEVGINDEGREASMLSKAYLSILTAYFDQLDEIRNFFTHDTHNPICYKCFFIGEKKHFVLKTTDSIYDGALNKTKTNFGVDEGDILHLRRYKTKGKEILLRTEKDGFYYMLSQNQQFTEKGIAFFISLFLDKKYGYLFLKQLTGFKRGESAKYRMTLEVFTALSTKPPIERLEVDKNEKLNFSLDILTELSKIPVELYKTLSPEFRKAYNEAGEENDPDELIRARVRYRDRFDYFALRYLDEHPDFQNIGFHTYLGNYFHKGYSKHLIDGQREDRYINFHLYGFCKKIDAGLSGELKEMLGVDTLKVHDRQRVDISDFKPFIAEANPRYVVNNNTIGLKILSNGKNVYPTIDEKGAKTEVADYWLSKYELPAMVFYSYLRNQKDPVCEKLPSVEDILRRYDQKEDKPRQTEEKQILMERRLEKSIHWTNSKLNEIDRLHEKDVAYGKKQYEELRAGRIADVLARDMVWLQPSKNGGKDKMSGPNFQALQRSIAYYALERMNLSEIFKKARLIESENQHPFLNQLSPADFNSLSSFYKAYLLRRKKYFEDQLLKVIKGKVGIPCYPLRDLQRSTPKKGIVKRPVFLPRTIFTELIKEYLIKKRIINKPDDSTEKMNVSYMILQYANSCMQPFYSESRNYTFLDKQFQKEMPIKKWYLTLEKRSEYMEQLKATSPIPVSNANDILEKEDRLYRKGYNEVRDNEKIIRLYQTQDILLFLIARAYLPDDLCKADMYKLNKIDGILNIPVNFSINVGDITVEASGVKMKNYGKVAAIRFDSRFKSLNDELGMVFPGKKSFPGGKKIGFEEYLAESESYEKYRVKLVELSHRFEKEMVARFNDIGKEDKGGYYKFTNLLNRYAKEIDATIDLVFLNNARNMFMHNSYKKECLAEKREKLNYAETIGNKYQSAIESMIERLQNRKGN